MSKFKNILIIAGVTTLFILCGFWGYLLLFGAPESVNQVFTDLGIRGGPTDVVVTDTDQTSQLAENEGRLVQLSTKAVAGFGYVTNLATGTSSATTTPSNTLVYAERGTGHIYKIDLSNNTETRISGTTVGQTIKAVFSDSGNEAVLVSENGNNTEASVYAFGSNTTKSFALSDNSQNFYFTSSSTVRYSVFESGQTVVYETNWLEGESRELWRTPMRDILIRWTDRGTYVINKVAPQLKSGVYEVVGGGLVKIIEPSYSLSADIDESGRFILYTAFDTELGGMINRLLDRESGESTVTTVAAIPEKCIFRNGHSHLCATSYSLSDTGNREAINKWYRGELTSSDTLWQGQEDGSAIYLDYLMELAGFELDVTNLRGTPDGNSLFFINRNNDALWVYRFE